MSWGCIRYDKHRPFFHYRFKPVKYCGRWPVTRGKSAEALAYQSLAPARLQPSRVSTLEERLMAEQSLYLLANHVKPPPSNSRVSKRRVRIDHLLGIAICESLIEQSRGLCPGTPPGQRRSNGQGQARPACAWHGHSHTTLLFTTLMSINNTVWWCSIATPAERR